MSAFSIHCVCLSLLQGIFPTQGSNPGLLHRRRILYHVSPQGSPQVNQTSSRQEDRSNLGEKWSLFPKASTVIFKTKITFSSCTAGPTDLKACSVCAYLTKKNPWYILCITLTCQRDWQFFVSKMYKVETSASDQWTNSQSFWESVSQVITSSLTWIKFFFLISLIANWIFIDTLL